VGDFAQSLIGDLVDFGGPIQDMLALALMAGMVVLGGFLLLFAAAWLITWGFSTWERIVAKVRHEPPPERW
jgi:hypothetical protein